MHRDNIGSAQAIAPGAINWMTAGRGIVHSERTPPELRMGGARLHGLQIWVALPKEHEEIEPAFYHHPVDDFPVFQLDGVTLRLLVGSAYGRTSPVRTLSPMFYLDAFLPAGARLAMPPEHRERAAYVVGGAVSCGAERALPKHMLVFAEGAEAILHAEEDSHLALIGGAPLDGPRHIWWNFRFELERAHRAGQARLERRPICQGTRRRDRVHSASRRLVVFGDSWMRARRVPGRLRASTHRPRQSPWARCRALAPRMAFASQHAVR